MNYQELITLLPCHSLEDFPQHFEGEDADGLLACWTAAWHPRFLAASGSQPKWYRADDPPALLKDSLVLVPEVSHEQLPKDLLKRAKDDGAAVISRKSSRAEIVDRGLANMEKDPGVDQELVKDFFALSYGYLQIQLLTRQMRYSSNLDENQFHSQLISAASHACAREDEEAITKLTTCFDMLAEERDHFYSVEAFLIDLTLVASTTLGDSLRTSLQEGIPSNILLCAGLLDALSQEPESFELVTRLLDQNLLTIVGGEYTESANALISCESILAQLKKGRSHYQKCLRANPNVYGRWRFGFTPMLPQILNKLGFIGAVHSTFEAGRNPEGSQSKTRWEGCDGSAVDAIAKTPFDAGRSETFLGFAQRLGESMDMDHVATLCLAHWPGQASPWYEDLKRCTRFNNCLGKFVTLETYFRDTFMPGHLDRFELDQYRSPYLKQQVIRRDPNPISTVVDYWQEECRRESLAGLKLLHDLSSDGTHRFEKNNDPSGDAERDCSGAKEFCSQIAANLSAREQPQGGILLTNPSSTALRSLIDTSILSAPPADDRPVYASQTSDDRPVAAVVDVPAMGFAWLSGRADGRISRKKRQPLLVDDRRKRDKLLLLRNEFCELVISLSTGGLQSAKDYRSRNSRLSQQLALRAGGPKSNGGSDYSRMVSSRIDVLENSNVRGKVQTAGSLLDTNGSPVAEFVQDVTLIKGSRVVEFEVEIQPLAELGPDPWNSYFATRFAWHDETATVYRAANETRSRTEAKRFESPLFIDVESGESRTTILCGGLPYHRRVDFRMLDTLLIVRGEECRTFRFGLGIDLPNSLTAAKHLLTPAYRTEKLVSEPSSGTSAWLFHIDSRNIAATSWESIYDDETLVGARVRLLETQGKSSRTKLSCFRPLVAARRIDFAGNSIGECQLDDGRAVVELSANEWTEFEVRWKKLG